MQPLALQPALHVGEGDDDGVDLAVARSRRAQVRPGSGSGRSGVGSCGLQCRRIAVRSSAEQAAQQRGRVVAVLSITRRARWPRPARIGVDDRARAGASEWSMLTSSTGIALSMSCRSAWTARHRPISERRLGHGGDRQVEAASRPAGARPGRCARDDLVAGAPRAGPAGAAVSAAAGGDVARRPARRPGGRPACPASSRLRAAEARGPRADGFAGPDARRRCRRRDRGWSRPVRPPAARRSPRAASPGRPPSRSASSRSGGSVGRAGRRPSRIAVASCSTHASNAWCPRTGRQHGLASSDAGRGRQRTRSVSIRATCGVNARRSMV